MMHKSFLGKKHIIWDWNGTLLDDVDFTLSIGNRLLQKNNKPTVTKYFYLENFCFPVSEYYRKLGFDVDNLDFFKELCEDFVKMYMEGVTSCRVKEEMLVIIHNLADQGIKQSVLSASEQNVLNIMLKQQKLNGVFENVFGLSDKAATCKRERGKQLIELIDVEDISELLIVGDTVHDLEVGRDNGVEVLLVAHGHNSLDRLQNAHDQILQFY